MIRAFIAVNLSIGVLRGVGDVERALRLRCTEDGWDVRWVAPPNQHVMLRYLGEVGPALAAPLRDALHIHALPLPSFPLRARGLGLAEGGQPSPRIVVGIEDPEAGLAALDSALSVALEAVGLEPDLGKADHCLVIGRVRSTGRDSLDSLLGSARAADFGESVVSEVVVYRSDLADPGREFRALVRVPLQGERPQPMERAPGERPVEGTTEVEPVPAGEAVEVSDAREASGIAAVEAAAEGGAEQADVHQREEA